MVRGLEDVRAYRRANSDSYNFNWLLRIPHELQQPFEPTHEAMAALKLRRETPPAQTGVTTAEADSPWWWTNMVWCRA